MLNGRTAHAPDLKTISKFAQLEYKLGEPERGKTLFEGIVDSHPKRWDLWTIYIDMEVGQNDIQSMRLAIDIVLWRFLPSLSLLFTSEISSIVCLLKK